MRSQTLFKSFKNNNTKRKKKPEQICTKENNISVIYIYSLLNKMEKLRIKNKKKKEERIEK